MSSAPENYCNKIVHITTVHSPFDVRIFHKQCVSLAKSGYDVTLIQRGDRRETRNGVKIVALPSYRTRLGRMTFGVLKAIRLALSERPALVHLHDVELIWGGLFLKAFGSRVVYDVHEDVVKDLEDKAYLPRWALSPLRAVVYVAEKLAVLTFDHISAATGAISRRFPSARVTLVRNTPILNELAAAAPIAFAERPPNATYLGGLADFNGPSQMVRAIGLVSSHLGAKLILGGRFPNTELENEVRALDGWEHVEFIGWIDRSQIGDVFARGRCGLVVYQPSPNVLDAEPNKFFEILSAGLPLVASDFPIWRSFVEQYGCGLLVDPQDPASIADAIEFLLAHPVEAEAMGLRGRAAIENSYNWNKDCSNLLAMYDKVLGHGPTSMEARNS